ncbi:MAG: HAMP domain-containing histidine kinase, partial [Okeania sp. SIO1H6]|nr:HAMP domain-containing histidine kinase [Okeania sp. SIO1H6]
KTKIFQQGYTTKGVGKGTGLGMAIAHQIVTEKHGGQISCDSTVGQGTIFRIIIPR